MKRLLAVLLAGLMVLSLAACTPSQDADYIIYSDNAFAPFEFMKDGAYTGVDMDLMAAIAEDQGFTYTMKNEGFDAAMGAVQAGQADGMIAGMTINDKRKETYDFSDGYFEDGQIMVVAANSTIAAEADLAGKKVAAKKGTESTKYAESLKPTYGFEIIYYDDSPAMYQAVLTGAADACFEDFSVIGWAIKNDGIALKTVGEVVNKAYYGFAVKKGTNPELIEMFNKGLANIKANGKYEAILAKYGY
ncbi:MAG: transporter substrate-binding domain-containing protein [Clostridia bacterium]|nr:transporter substrate-binding domain-containing protein [Clostridia bacterium]